MSLLEAQSATLEFAALGLELSEAQLNTPWNWGEYEEGVRFAFFRVYEELRTLAEKLAAQRAGLSPQTRAQRILAQHQAAWRDLQAVLLGISAEQAALPPAEGEWPVSEALMHIMKAEFAFSIAIHYAVERERSQDGRPPRLSDEGFGAAWKANDFNAPFEAPFSQMWAAYEQRHNQIQARLAGISDAELAVKAVYWEAEHYPLEFRLHRFDSHLRQHTIQVEKTLAALGLHPGEAKLLLRRIYNALAEVEGALIGAPESGAVECAATAARIRQISGEVQAALASV